MTRFILFVAFIVLCEPSHAQQAIDTAFYNRELGQAQKLLLTAPDKAALSLKGILNQATKEGYNKGALEASLYMGTQLQMKRDYQKSIALLDSVAQVAEQNDLAGVQAMALREKGWSLYKEGSYYAASIAALESLKASERLSDITPKIKAYHLLGGVYFQLEEYATAKKYIAKCIELSHQLGDTIHYFKNSYNYCNCLVEEENHAEALICLNKLALKFREHRTNKTLYWLNSYIESARLQCKPTDTGTLDRIFENLTFIEQQENQLKGSGYKVQLYAGFTKYYILMRDPILAEKNLLLWQSLLDGEVNGSSQESREILLVKSDLYRLKGDHQKALSYYTQYIENRLLALKNNESHKIHQLTLHHESEKKDQVLETKKIALVLLAESSEKQQWFVVFVLSLLLALGLTGFAFYFKRRNLHLEKVRENALEDARAKTLFLEVISHELKAPLIAIMENSSLLEKEEKLKTQQRLSKALKFSCEHLKKLIENTALLRTLGEYKDTVDVHTESMQKFNCRELLEKVRLNFTHSRKGNRILLSIEPSIPQFLIGPELDIYRVINNLVLNADRFTHKGYITLAVRSFPSARKNSLSVKFTVSDTSNRPRKKEQELILNPFYVGSSIDKEASLGLGLELKLTESLLKRHHCRPTKERIYGTGSAIGFTMELLLPSKLQLFGSNTLEPQRKGGNILLVEDDKTNQESTKKMIERMGYHCDVADNGKIAVEKYKMLRYDLVLMDMMMPVMNGFVAIEKINELDKNANIIALTAISKDRYRDFFRELNIHTVISKPISEKSIREAIANCLHKESQAA